MQRYFCGVNKNMNAEDKYAKKVKEIQKKAIVKHLKRMVKELQSGEIEILDFGETFELVDGWNYDDRIINKVFSGAKVVRIKTQEIRNEDKDDKQS